MSFWQLYACCSFVGWFVLLWTIEQYASSFRYCNYTNIWLKHGLNRCMFVYIFLNNFYFFFLFIFLPRSYIFDCFSSMDMIFQIPLISCSVCGIVQDRFLAYSPEEHPVVLQIGGNNLENLAKATQLANAYRYDEINFKYVLLLLPISLNSSFSSMSWDIVHLPAVDVLAQR